ncbi:MAG: hypothetical protein GX829_04075 [Clostridium sp.]|nr:hypothetical protein [Clostridium sp.]
MKSMIKSMIIVMLMTTQVVLSGCAFFGMVPGVDEYVETAQEGVADNEELIAYVEELKPVISIFYGEGRSLEDIKVQGNEIHVKVNLGEDTSPYESAKDLMVYETTRISHTIMTYRDYEVIDDMYKIVIGFTDEKEVVLYKDQAVENEGVSDFTPETILNAVKR